MATAALPMPMGGSAAALRAAESRAASRVGNGGWTYTGTGRDDNADGKVKAKGKVKNKIVAIIIVALLGGGGAFLGSSNSLLAPAIENLFTEATDTQYTSANLRTRSLAKKIFFGDDVNVVKNSGLWKKTKFDNISFSLKKRLAKNGITFEGSGSNKVAKFNGETITAAEWSSKLNSDIELRDAYTSSTRGRVATFFDNVANKIYQNLGISRNLFNSYRQTGDADVDAASYRQTLSSKFDTDVDLTTRSAHETDVDEDGNTSRYTETTTSDGTKTNTDAATAKASSMLSDISSKVTQAAQGVCSLIRVVNIVSLTVAAMEIAQSIDYFMSDIENISKMMSGQGDASAVNALLNKYSTPMTSTVTNFASTNVSFSGSSESSTFTAKAADYTDNKSPLESIGMQTILGGAPANKSKASSLYSFERIFTAMGTAFAASTLTSYGCATADIVAGGVSIVVDILSFGTSKIVTSVLKILGAVALSITVSVALQFLLPTIAQSVFTNIAETVTGSLVGEYFTRGAAASNMRVGRSGSGQSPASKEAVLAYNHATQEVIAFDAEVERARSNPFDITNKNTFFGSIAYSLLPVLTNSKATSIASLIRTTAKSLTSTISPVNADGENSSYLTTISDSNDCPLLDTINVVGDIYCNPIVVTDLDTIDIELNNPTYTSVINDNLNPSNGNIQSGNLANYINFCANRESPFGATDENILGQMQASAGTVGDAILSNIPVIGGIFDIITGTQNNINMDWATGKKCTNTNENKEFWESEGQYYQRYIEDSRILEEMGMIDENPVTAYREQYLKEHPLDNSQSGILARMTGQTKENIEIALAFIDYYQYLETYDPSARIAMNEPTLSEKSGEQVATEIKSERLYFEDKSIIDSREEVIIAKQYIVYSDLRNRSYTV